MSRGSTRVKEVLVVIALLVLVAGSTALYYNSLLTQRGEESAAAIQSLQNSVQALQESNNVLSKQLSALNEEPNNSTIANPAQIYSLAHLSVVTIQGAIETTVNTFFGPQESVSTVLGSGFVTTYQGAGYVITNYHVVDGVKNLTVTFSDGNAYAAKVIGTDPYSDLAVVTVAGAPPSEFVPLQIVSSSGVTVGEQVYAIGNPYGLSGSMTLGIISQVGRTIQDPVAGNFSVAGAIQFSAPINPGNSGGPLLNTAGQVIGITTATVTSSQGIGFAIPSSTIIRDLPYLVTTGTYSKYSYMGINGVDMNYQLAQASGTNVTYGVLIENVVAGGPAAKAGLEAGTKTVTIDGSQYLVGGDIIVSINGTKIINLDALSTYLVQNTVAGQTVILGVIRSGTLITLSLVLGTRPAA